MVVESSALRRERKSSLAHSERADRSVVHPWELSAAQPRTPSPLAQAAPALALNHRPAHSLSRPIMDDSVDDFLARERAALGQSLQPATEDGSTLPSACISLTLASHRPTRFFPGGDTSLFDSNDVPSSTNTFELPSTDFPDLGGPSLHSRTRARSLRSHPSFADLGTRAFPSPFARRWNVHAPSSPRAFVVLPSW